MRTGDFYILLTPNFVMDLFQIPMKIPTILYKACNDYGVVMCFLRWLSFLILCTGLVNVKSCGVSAAFLCLFLAYENLIIYSSLKSNE